MSDCDCCDEEEDTDDEKYEAFMRAGELMVQIEAESSEEADHRVQNLWNKAIEEVQRLNEDERRSVGLK